MKDPKILYFLIGLFCIFAIIAGFYAQFIDPDYGGLNILSNYGEATTEELSQEEIKTNFNALFTNTLNLGEYDTTGISRLNSTQEIVYSAYDIEQNTSYYELNMHIPLININSELASKMNQNTQDTFVSKANDVMQNQDATNKIIYTIDYTAYINNNILSLVIMSTLKEGDSAQRIIVQTYNYNLETNEEVSLVDLVTIKMLNTDEVNSKIIRVVTEANAEDEALQNMGYSQVYVRDLTSDIYTVENAGAYFLGPSGDLYIVYAYGNSEYTSKMDIVYFE